MPAGSGHVGMGFAIPAAFCSIDGPIWVLGGHKSDHGFETDC
jgi:hypothetical protein